MARPDTSASTMIAIPAGRAARLASAADAARAMVAANARAAVADLATRYEAANADHFHTSTMARVAYWTGAPGEDEIDAAIAPLNVWGL